MSQLGAAKRYGSDLRQTISPLKGFLCICSKAALNRRWLLAGALANSFSARFARMSVQLMKKLLKSYKFAAPDLSATFADGIQFGLGGLNNRKSAFEVLPPGFAQQLRASAVFLLLDAFHLLDHGRR